MNALLFSFLLILFPVICCEYKFYASIKRNTSYSFNPVFSVWNVFKYRLKLFDISKDVFCPKLAILLNLSHRDVSIGFKTRSNQTNITENLFQSFFLFKGNIFFGLGKPKISIISINLLLRSFFVHYVKGQQFYPL